MYAYVRSIDRQVAVNLSSVENSKLFTISTDWMLVYSRINTQHTQNSKSTIN